MKLLVGFSAPKKWKLGAELIKFWTKKSYSHVFVCWRSDKYDRDLVYHAAHGSVHFNSLETFLIDNNVVLEFTLDLDKDQDVRIIQRCIDLSSIKYGYSELIKIFISDLFKLPFNFFKNDRGYICSELLADLLEELGYEFTKPSFLVKPNDVEEALRRGGLWPA